MNQLYKVYYPSEIGLIKIVGDEASIKFLDFVEAEAQDSNINQADLPRVISDCLAQLDEYFRGKRVEFSLKLDPEGTKFQKAVWRQLTTIPYGQTVSYLDIAKKVGDEKSGRAVGAANGQNPISIIIPCHRVIGSDGKLVGYGGGLWRKEWLLKHEKTVATGQLSLF
jgi:methylated-DNA-[protein]-cysteine S-methyltransferase